jgi:hypothetical protein
MNNEAPLRSLSAEEWKSLLDWVGTTQDPLEDGAIARRSEDAEPAIDFYASAINKPKVWRYPFLEELPGYERPVEMVGRAWREDESDAIKMEAVNMAAAKAVTADYESGTEAMDDIEYERTVESALAGTPEDGEWLDGEYRRLLTHFRTRIR